MRSLALISMLVVCCPIIRSQPTPPSVASLKYLLGRWVGEGTSDAGAGSGYFTFERELGNRVLVRRNHAEYPATKDRPAFVHEDLMIIYSDPAANKLRGFYTDSEGNTINYTITLSTDAKTLVFLSDAGAGPRYRLTYVSTQPDRIELTFEMAPPDKPDAFRKLIDGRVRKVAAAR